MKDRITIALEGLEKQNDVRIIYAAESGSRGWGFASQDSDYDVRFLYVHRPEWYLSIGQKPDTIELPADAVLDINGWDLKKSLLHIKKSNPTIFEWLDSPIVYTECGSVASSLREAAKMYFSPAHTLHHYLAMADRQYKECAESGSIRLKKYFYMLRPLFACLWIEQYAAIPPMEFRRLLGGLSLNENLTSEIEKLMKRKALSDESQAEAANPLLLDFIGTQVEHFNKVAESFAKGGSPSYDTLDKLFLEALAQTWGAEWLCNR